MTESELSEGFMFDQYYASTLHWSGLHSDAEGIAAYVATLSEAEQNRRKHLFAEAIDAYMVFGDWRARLQEQPHPPAIRERILCALRTMEAWWQLVEEVKRERAA